MAPRTLLLLTIAILDATAQSGIVGPMPALDGEICIVCYGRTTKSDLAYVVDGNRYAVMKGLENDFLKQPHAYIRKFNQRHRMPPGAEISGFSSAALYSGLGGLVVVLSAAFWWLDGRKPRKMDA